MLRKILIIFFATTFEHVYVCYRMKAQKLLFMHMLNIALIINQNK